jgi:two-component system, sensor histidine kinase and response regulator
MPEMDGYEATVAIRSREGSGGHIPIIAMTAGARTEDKEKCKSSGMDGYVSKPVRRSELLEQLELHLRAAMNPSQTVGPGQQSTEVTAPHAIEQSLPQEPVLDGEVFDELYMLHGENRDGLDGLIREFIVQTSDAVAQLRAAVTARSAADVQRIAHSVKGASAQLGGSQLAGSCSRLEQHAKSDDLSQSDRQIEEVEATFCSLEKALSERLVTAAPVGA